VQVVRAGARTGWGDISTLVHLLAGLARPAAYLRRLFRARRRHPGPAVRHARRGVQVELLVNGPHADKCVSRLASEDQFELLLAAGVRVWTYQPTMLHAKITLVDDLVASTGSANLNARSMVLDEELNLVMFDPRIVEVLGAHFDEDLERAQEIHLDEWSRRGLRQKGLEALPGFLARVNNWAEVAHPFYDEDVDLFPLRDEAGTSDVQIVRGDAETGWGDIATLSRVLLGFARHRVRISADYLAPDPAALDALCAVARRGVKVEVLRPGPHARKRLPQVVSRSYYDPLLEAGVRVWEYQPTAFETKVITVDGEVANIGSVDFDAGSLTLNDEVTVVVFDPTVVAVLDEQFDADLERAEPVELADWAGRDRRQRAVEATTGFFARHL